MERTVEPEWLDELPATDPQAIRSRRDLRRVNVLMGHARLLSQAFARLGESTPLERIAEIGAGDGTCLTQFALHLASRGPKATVQLVDQQNLLGAETRAAFEALGWTVAVEQADVFEWLARPAPARADLLIANLFLHHFAGDRLRELLRLAAQRTNLFMACEPRRSRLALTASRLVGLVGCNAVTRHDAVVSVRAGFAGQELSALWPEPQDWRLVEQPAGLFSHCFIAQRLQR